MAKKNIDYMNKEELEEFSKQWEEVTSKLRQYDLSNVYLTDGVRGGKIRHDTRTGKRSGKNNH